MYYIYVYGDKERASSDFPIICSLISDNVTVVTLTNPPGLVVV